MLYHQNPVIRKYQLEYTLAIEELEDARNNPEISNEKYLAIAASHRQAREAYINALKSEKK